MKYILSLLLFVVVSQQTHAQISITAADMPVTGDTLRYSFASPAGTGVSLTDTGAGVSWNYSFTPTGQAIDTYQAAISVNPLYALTIGLSAYGYKVSDSSPLPLPMIPGLPSIQQVYTFFEKKSSPSRYQAKAFAAVIASIPTPINYTQPDVWYFFPLSYLNRDSAHFKLSITLPGFGGIVQEGVRRTRVDGWGTITTPFYTTPTNCIRVRSVIQEVDSVQFGSFPAFGLPRTTVEYKWLVNGDHYPALWVTANMGPTGETIGSIRYRDNPMSMPNKEAVQDVRPQIATLSAYPNPSINGAITIDIPDAWQNFTVEVFDATSKLITTVNNSKQLDMSALAAGRYLVRVVSNSNIGYAQVIR